MSLFGARSIRDVVGGGMVQGAHGVYITVAFLDATRETFHCDLVFLPRLIESLRRFGAVADDMRAKIVASGFVDAVPFAVTHVLDATPAPDGKDVRLELQTNDGYPIRLTLSRQPKTAPVRRP